VVHRRRAGVDRDPHPRPVGQLIAVHPQTQSLAHARRQHPAGLRLVEGPVLAEHIDPPDVRGHPVQHRPTHQVQVAIGVLGEFRRHDVRSEE
jgi:hypothetical protein